jgi:RNA polymerase sigma-70 factor (ECF subfamily)
MDDGVSRLDRDAEREREAALAALRPDLVRFARLQLRDAAAAEDVVQECLLAALGGQDRFASRSSLKTWVFGILRHKIVDLIRIRAREPNVGALLDEDEDNAAEQLAGGLFDAHGYWRSEARPGRWADPEDTFEQQQFWAVFEACLDRLPEKTARVFSMRELLGLDTDEICKETGISATNCWVVLHRARQALRACLEVQWFAGAGASR